MPAKRKKPASQPERAPLPEWVTTTMHEMEYRLEVMCGCGDCATESVDLTRDEFITLKHHLAKMRGFTVEEPVAEEVSNVSPSVQAGEQKPPVGTVAATNTRKSRRAAKKSRRKAA